MSVALTGAVTLTSALTLAQAAPLLKELLARRGQDLQVDASAVERLGGQCLQILLSAAATAAKDGAQFEIVRPSDDFLRAIETYGVALERFHAQESAQ